ncbi:MAG: hypothetical protein IH611_12815 [Deltaproteobacteria bacterium]|nr:hypothetical protein [Deltaproteobacteria bacterium]
MRTQRGTWLVILVAAVVFALSGAIPAAAGADRYAKSAPVDEGYGDFHTLFIDQGNESADRDLMKSPAYDMGKRGDTPLAYAIPEARLPYNFTWVALFLDKGSRIVLNQVSALVVTTPISGAALLLGSGIICLIGLRRRERHQA